MNLYHLFQCQVSLSLSLSRSLAFPCLDDLEFGAALVMEKKPFSWIFDEKAGRDPSETLVDGQWVEEKCGVGGQWVGE